MPTCSFLLSRSASPSESESALHQRIAALEAQLRSATAHSPTGSPSSPPSTDGRPGSISHDDAVVRCASLEVSIAALEAENSELLARLEDRIAAENEAAARVADELQALNKEVSDAKDALAAEGKAHAADIARLRSEMETARSASTIAMRDDAATIDRLKAEVDKRDSYIRTLEGQLTSNASLQRRADAATIDALRSDMADRDGEIRQLEVQLATAVATAKRDMETKEVTILSLSRQLDQALADASAVERRAASAARGASEERDALMAQLDKATAETESLRHRVDVMALQESAVVGVDARREDRVRELEEALYTTVASLRTEKREKDMLQQRCVPTLLTTVPCTWNRVASRLLESACPIYVYFCIFSRPGCAARSSLCMLCIWALHVAGSLRLKWLLLRRATKCGHWRCTCRR